MQLGTHVFSQLPRDMTLIRPDKSSASVQTYTGVAFFSWDPDIAGKEIVLSWNGMTTEEFDALDLLFQANEAVAFDPEEALSGSTTTYQVEIVGLDGEYVLGALELRQNVELTLLILEAL